MKRLILAIALTTTCLMGCEAPKQGYWLTRLYGADGSIAREWKTQRNPSHVGGGVYVVDDGTFYGAQVSGNVTVEYVEYKLTKED